MDPRLKRLLTALTARPVISVFLFALTIRLLAAGAISLLSDGTLFLDDKSYLNAIRIGGGWEPPYEDPELVISHDLQWGRLAAFYQPNLFLFRLIGPYVFVAQLLSAVAGAVTAAAVAKIVRHHASSKVALGAGLLIAVYPSQVLWSSLLMRDAFAWMALSLVAVVLTWWGRREDLLGFGVGTLALAVLTLYLGGIREGSLIVCCLAVVIAMLWKGTSLRIPKLAVAGSLLFLIPLVFDAGMFGIDALRYGISGLEDQRQAAASGGTGISSFGDTVSATAFINDLLYLPAGFRLVLLDPLPHQMFDKAVLALPFVEHLIWYPALLLAAFGLPEIRRGGADLAYVVFVAFGLATMWSLVDGNFGTAFRHRGEVTWAVVVLAAVGTERLLKRRKCSNGHTGS